MIRRIAVVIPARDEEELIGRCLASVLESSRHVTVPVDVIVVADGCLDSTASVARSVRGVRVVEVDSSNVGTARSIGVAAALDRRADWIANTDADSVVPRDWLLVQLELAAAGHDVVVGTVRPDFDDLGDDQRSAWEASHAAGVANGHVHGANLGVRASAYLAVGGYRTMPEHEDVDLVARLAGFDVVASARAQVVTSGRRFGRTAGGYARYLREDLVVEPAPR